MVIIKLFSRILTEKGLKILAEYKKEAVIWRTTESKVLGENRSKQGWNVELFLVVLKFSKDLQIVFRLDFLVFGFRE